MLMSEIVQNNGHDIAILRSRHEETRFNGARFNGARSNNNNNNKTATNKESLPSCNCQIVCVSFNLFSLTQRIFAA